MLRKLGSAKYKLIRVVAYVQLVNLAILVQVNGWQAWYLTIPPIFFILYWFENKYGIAGELDVAWQKSGEWQAFKAQYVLNNAYFKFRLEEIKDAINSLQRTLYGVTTRTEQSTQTKADKEIYRYTLESEDDLRRRGRKLHRTGTGDNRLHKRRLKQDNAESEGGV